MLLEAAVADCWDDDAWHTASTALLQDVRHSGALALLPEALAFRAGLHLQCGEFSSAAELLAEASDRAHTRRCSRPGAVTSPRRRV